VSLRSLQAFNHPQYAPHAQRPARPSQCVEQRRALNLYKTARAKTVLGQHKVLTFEQYDVKKAAPIQASEHRVNLYQAKKKESDRTLIAEDITLQTLYDDYVKEGQLLYNLKGMRKNTIETMRVTNPEIIEEYRDVALMASHTHSVPIKDAQKKNAGNNLGPLKVVIFTIASPPEYVRMCLDRAYQFIEHGCPVEMRTRMASQKLTKEERVRAGNPEIWPWIHSHFPHLRPDFILKSMPAGTEYFVKPVSDGRIVQWVMGIPAKNQTKLDFTERLFVVKHSVKKSIEEGNQAMLPRVMREQLKETGNLNYSAHTGLPKSQARMKYAAGGRVTYGSEERKHVARDLESDGFMVPNLDEAALLKPLIRYETRNKYIKAPGGDPYVHERGKSKK